MPYAVFLALLIATAPTAPGGGVPACCESSEAGRADPTAEIRTLVRDADGRIYGGGQFLAGDSTVWGVAELSDDRWALVGDAFPDPVADLVVGRDGALYAARPFDSGSAAPVVRWTGSEWATVGSLEGFDAHALTVGPDGALYAAVSSLGQTRVVRWTGAAWRPLSGDLFGDVNALAAHPDGSVYVGGRFEPPDALHAESVLRWTGAAWEAVGGGTNGIVVALALGPDGALYAGGEFDHAGGPVHDVARWDGTAWTALGEIGLDSGMNVDGVMTLAVGPGGSVYAGGRFRFAYGVPARCIARWSDGAWQAVGDGWPGPIGTILATPDGSVYVAGFMESNGARWDGAAWTALPDL